jgi:RimJ/RimL family protein N-acetyltransferase
VVSGGNWLHHQVMIDDAVNIAERLVRERFPDARAVWLGGSAVTNSMTSTSDLDVTVLLGSDPAPFRESLNVGGQPVELFVHTEDSLRFFCAHDLRRRRPTTLRLIGTSVLVIDADGVGRRLQEEFGRLDREGPPALSDDEIEAARYVVTDLLDDLSDGSPEALSIAAALWRETAELLLGANARWSGSGKWLQRELRTLDGDRGTNHADALLSGLAAVSRGDVTAMQDAVMAALAPIGGRLFEGYRHGGTGSLATPALAQPRLKGEGVVLRPFAETDVDVVIEAGRDPLIPLIATVCTRGDRSDALEYIANQHSRSATGTGWSYAIADAATGRAVGQIGLRRCDIEHGRASVGYWVAANQRGRGYAGRALRVLTAWAATIPEITRIELYVEPFNDSSWRAAESAGYHREGLLRRWQVVAGEPRDMYMYAKIP